MKTLIINMQDQHLFASETADIISDSQKYLKLKLIYPPEYSNLKISLSFKGQIGIFTDFYEEEMLIPHEVITVPGFSVSAIFTDNEGLRITSDELYIEVKKSGYEEGLSPALPTPSIYEKIISSIQNTIRAPYISENGYWFAYDGNAEAYVNSHVYAGDHESSELARDAANRSESASAISQEKAEEALLSAETAESAANAAKLSEISANDSRINAKESEINSGESEQKALNAEQIASQAMSDFLEMLSSDIATLTNGKLSPSQIPDISINDVFEVENAEQILTLNAQRGDVALVLENSIVSDSYILAADEATEFSNWKKLGISYVANSGHSVTSDSAENADKINNKRIISMTQTQYDNAVLNSDTFYFVTQDEEV